MAIRELLEHRTEDIDIPIYLADSIVSPEVGKTLFSKDRYEIKAGSALCSGVMRGTAWLLLLSVFGLGPWS